MATLPPTSQQSADRPIAFLLDDDVSGVGPAKAVTLRIRPEDLTRVDSTRFTAVQTLNGGAWIDDYGPGLAAINISGTTGWRRTPGGIEDGEQRFLALRAQVWEQWHLRRKQAVKQAKDPNGVRLIYSDALDSIVATVVPGQFSLRRSRSRPLLLQYQIQMLVIADSPGALIGPPALARNQLSESALSALGLASLDNALTTIQNFARDAQMFIDRTLLAPVQAFLAQTQQIYGRVSDTWNSIAGVSNSLIAVANTTAAAGANLFRTLAIISNLPTLVQGEIVRVGAAYMNIYCVLRNALKLPVDFIDYSELYGASNCSSTSGGSPLSQFAGSNTLEALVPAPVAPVVAVSTSAQASMTALGATDVVLAPMSPLEAAAHAGNIGSGIVLS